MYLRPKLLSRMKDPQLQDPELLQQTKDLHSLMNRMSQDPPSVPVTQPTISDRQSHLSSTTPSSSNSGTYQNVLVECNNLIEEY